MTAFIGKKTSFGAEVGTGNPKLQLASCGRGFNHVTTCYGHFHNLVLSQHHGHLH
jgi:hypothetical protein